MGGSFPLYVAFFCEPTVWVRAIVWREDLVVPIGGIIARIEIASEKCCIFRLFDENIFPIIHSPSPDSFPAVKACTDPKHLQTIANKLVSQITWVTQELWSRKCSLLFFREVAVVHYYIEIGYASWNWSRRIGDVFGRALYIKIDTFGTCPLSNRNIRALSRFIMPWFLAQYLYLPLVRGQYGGQSVSNWCFNPRLAANF